MSVLNRQSGVHWSCYVLLSTGCVTFGQSRLSGLSLGAKGLKGQTAVRIRSADKTAVHTCTRHSVKFFVCFSHDMTPRTSPLDITSFFLLLLLYILIIMITHHQRIILDLLSCHAHTCSHDIFSRNAALFSELPDTVF